MADFRMGKAILCDGPIETMLVAERFFSEGGGMQLIVRTPFEARISRAWRLVLERRGSAVSLRSSSDDRIRSKRPNHFVENVVMAGAAQAAHRSKVDASAKFGFKKFRDASKCK